MATPVTRRGPLAPNASYDADILLLLDKVCANLPNSYARQLVRGVIRLKLELGFEGDVRNYLRRRSGEYSAVSAASPKADK